MTETTEYSPDRAFEIEKMTILYSMDYLPCSEKDCLQCLIGEGHGPYWYASFELQGETKKIFLGKTFKPLDLNSAIVTELLNKKRKERQTGNEPNSNLVDRVEIDRFQQTRRKAPKQVERPVLPPPTERDFQQDIDILKGMRYPDGMKRVYRKLIKKYHPDRYPDHNQMNLWMAEINGLYHKLLKQIGKSA